jgi:hypothetical protein
MFDSSVARGQPATFRLNEVIQGWTIGVGLMVEGEKRRLWIPEKLAYQGQPGAPAGMLGFDVELIRIPVGGAMRCGRDAGPNETRPQACALQSLSLSTLSACQRH